eukprot:5764561-Amphidinium_carterae.1
MDPTTSHHEGHHVEPARTVTTEWDTPYPIIGKSAGAYRRAIPENANDLIRHIQSGMTQGLRFRICGVNFQRKDDAIKNLRQWRNELSIT